jgi:hypothetical protein
MGWPAVGRPMPRPCHSTLQAEVVDLSASEDFHVHRLAPCSALPPASSYVSMKTLLVSSPYQRSTTRRSCVIGKWGSRRGEPGRRLADRH